MICIPYQILLGLNQGAQDRWAIWNGMGEEKKYMILMGKPDKDNTLNALV